MINTRKLEAFVIEAIRNRILTEEHITELVSLVTDELRTRDKSTEVESRSTEKSLTDVDRRLGKGLGECHISENQKLARRRCQRQLAD